jgi:hypothetical protein
MRLLLSLSDSEGLALTRSGLFYRNWYLSVLRHISEDAAAEAYQAVWSGRNLLTHTIINRSRFSRNDPTAQSISQRLQAVRSELSAAALGGQKDDAERHRSRMTALNREKE